MNARKQSAFLWINGSILTMTTNLCKMLRKIPPKIMTAMILAVYQSTINGSFRRI